jgi:hypothetical protein
LKKLAFLGAAAGVGVGALLVMHTPTHAADHLDGPAIFMNPMADITDVYAWNDSTATKVNLIMDVSPADPTGTGSAARPFGPSILYVFHVTSVAAFGPPPLTGTTTNVICKFATDTSAECWVGDKGYIKGDPSAAGGITSPDGKIKFFAGRRSDPFFFNFNGLKDTIAQVNLAQMGAAGSSLTNLDSPGSAAMKDGCPELLPAANGSALRGLLMEGAQGSNGHFPCNDPNNTSADCFINFDVKSIVLQIDKSLLNAGANTVLSVWASTNSPG